MLVDLVVLFGIERFVSPVDLLFWIVLDFGLDNPSGTLLMPLRSVHSTDCAAGEDK